MELKGHDNRVERFRDGDRELLTELYRAHHDDVEAMLRGGFTFTSKGETVRFQGFRQPYRLREAIQDGFIHAFKQRVREGYDPSRSYRPYLMTVIRNHLIDQFRRKQLESNLFVAPGDLAEEGEAELNVLDRLGQGSSADSGASVSSTPEQSPEDTTLRQELGELLRDFVGELKGRDEQVLRLYLVGDRTQTETAEELGISRNDVRKSIRMIRQQLLGHLKREEFIGQSDVDDVFRTLAKMGLVLGWRTQI